MDTKIHATALQPQGKNLVLAYVFWWFLGWAGVHRFYLGQPGSGICQLLLVMTGWLTIVVFVGFAFLFAWFVWWAFDAYLIQKYVAEYNAKLGLPASGFTAAAFKFNRASDLDQLEKLHSLYEKGIINKEEYEARKAQLL